MVKQARIVIVGMAVVAWGLVCMVGPYPVVVEGVRWATAYEASGVLRDRQSFAVWARTRDFGFRGQGGYMVVDGNRIGVNVYYRDVYGREFRGSIGLRPAKECWDC